MKILKYALLAIAVSAGPAMAIDTSILQKDQAFSQMTITVHEGDLVRWGNADTYTHNVTVKGDGTDYNLGVQKPGQILSYKFDDVGTYSVICQIHPRMKMLVKVL